ncbi:MAG: hypothetical protein ACOYI4_09330 [Christensenellales bacterium]
MLNYNPLFCAFAHTTQIKARRICFSKTKPCVSLPPAAAVEDYKALYEAERVAHKQTQSEVDRLRDVAAAVTDYLEKARGMLG